MFIRSLLGQSVRLVKGYGDWTSCCRKIDVNLGSLQKPSKALPCPILESQSNHESPRNWEWLAVFHTHFSSFWV